MVLTCQQRVSLLTVLPAAKHKTLKRGVKEVVKSIRKGGIPTSAKDSPGIVVLAADISPMDVISHIPVLCEDHNIPYIYVTSRADLGAAGNTKRPTSVVMVAAEKKKKGGAAEESDEYAEVYAELKKIAVKAGATLKI
jgi:H/ACA ribonucleoprotein complex subunit 2